MKKDLVIVGAGETAHLAYEYFTHDSDYEVRAFAVEGQFREADEFLGLPLVDFENIDSLYPADRYEAFVAVSSPKLNRVRMKLYEMTKAKGYELASYVSSRAFRWRDVAVGDNCFILEDNTLQPFVTIGNNVTLWSGNHIGHRSTIRDNCFLTSHIVVSGFCEVGENAFIGVNSSVADHVKIAPDNFIAMATAINQDTEPDSVYSGNPAEKRKISAKRFCKVF
jgi:sugar O-acyltransferase (sialic acid O-acetyltransferase NeuD family)